MQMEILNFDQMNEVSYIPNIHFNMVSIEKRIIKGCKLGGNDKAILIEKDGSKFKFDGKVTNKKD